MKSRKKQCKDAVKGKLKAWVSRGSSAENYGFGSNWTLNIGRNNVPKKQMWLGQGGKVTSRMLGVDYGNYVKQVSTQAGIKKQWKNEAEWMGNKKVNKIITEDIIHSSMGDEYDQSSQAWFGKIDSKKLKKLMGAEAWGLAVQ